MFRFVISLVGIFFVFTLCHAEEEKGVLQPVINEEEGYVPIFNGVDLSGWKIHGEPSQWKVVNGEIVAESVGGEYGYLATEKKYKNFSIIAEFFGSTSGNSGLFFHSELEGVNIKGIQAEVAPFVGGHSASLYESGGRGWLIDPKSLGPEKENALRMNEWNVIRVDVRDHRIQTWLNGIPIVDFKNDAPLLEEGVIALQIHSGGNVKVRWRDLRVKEL